MVVGSPQSAHHEVVAGEADVRAGAQAVVLDRPVGKALAVEALVEHVLVEVEQHGDAGLAEHRDGRARSVEVAVVVAAGLGLERLPDDPQPQRVEALAREELGVSAPKPIAAGSYGGSLLTMFTPCRTTTRPCSSVSQRPA